MNFVLILMLIITIIILLRISQPMFYNNNDINSINNECNLSVIQEYLNKSESNEKKNLTNNIINCDIINKLNEVEPFVLIPKSISFEKIIPNNLYYGLSCIYTKDDTFYDALNISGYKATTNIKEASLIVPCSYETTEKEIKDLENEGIKENIFGQGVRIFMLSNTDSMVSKLALWQFLKNKYTSAIAATMIPYTWDLTDKKDTELFMLQYDPTKIYLTKNNQQRQEGLMIHNTLESILMAKNKYILVQELLQNPYLINGRKINLRVYVLVIRDSMNNIKLCVYKDGFMYYTPELFVKNNPSFASNITTGYIDRNVYETNPLTHKDFRKYLDSVRTQEPLEKQFCDSYPNIKLSDYIFGNIYQLMSSIFLTFEPLVGINSTGVNFQLYGVDVAIDDNLQPMVMEINKGPDLTAKDTRDKKLKIKLSTDILKSVGLLPNNDNDFVTVIEQININGKLSIIKNTTAY